MVRMMLATAMAAAMFDSWASRPVLRCVLESESQQEGKEEKVSVSFVWMGTMGSRGGMQE